MDWRPLQRAIGNRDVLATLVGFCAFTLVLHGAWLATIVYAFNQGGAAETGAVALIVLVPAAIVSPVVAVWFDRYSPRLALTAGLAVQGLALAAAAAAIAADQSKYLVYGLLACVAVAQMSSRPTVSSALPRLIVDPGELAAANSATGVVETIGVVAGPALAGLVLSLTDGTAVSFAVCAVTMGLGALASSRVRTPPRESVRIEKAHEGLWAQVSAGFGVLRSEAAPRHLVMIVAAMRLTVGVLEVAVVVIAIDHLGKSEGVAGVLGVAIGVGAVAGSAVTLLFVARRHLSGPIAIGLACTALPISAIAISSNYWLVLGFLVISGFGRPIVEVASRTLLQGLSNDDMLARIFGFLEGLSLLVLAMGSALFSWLAASISLEAALVVSGLLPIVVLALLFTRLRRIDADRPEVDPELLALVRSTPLFSLLAAFRTEQLLLNLHRQVWMPGQTIFEEGDYGEVLYVIQRGWVHIDIEDQIGLRRGGFFGEIAVLRDQPRMATVRAGREGTTTYRIHRDVFLDALATAPASQRRSQRIVEERLGET